MLKAISTITNAIGALNYKGTWNASTNTPTLASGVGTKGDYYVVSVAGSTALDGISNWGVGDLATYNGSVWQRVEGGADLNGVNLSVSGTSLLSGNTGVGGDTTGVVAGVTVTSKFCVKQDGTNPVAGFVKAENTTASSGAGTFACRSRGTIAAPTVVQSNDNLWSMFLAGYDGTDLALAAQIQVDVDGTPGSNDMPGRIVFSTTPDGSQIPTEAMRINSAQNVTVTAGNLVIGTSGNGIDFSATPGTGTSELLADYEEGTFTATLTAETVAPLTPVTATGYYTKIGRQVTIYIEFINKDTTGGLGVLNVTGLPFTASASAGTVGSLMTFGLASPNAYSVSYLASSGTVIKQYTITDNAAWATVNITAGATKFLYITHTYFV
jgi:hypothetical protein